MQLYYCRSFDYNFGDDLNPWLWPKIIPEVVNAADSSTLFIGIGTILNDEVPDARSKVVFGSGAGYGTLPRIDDSWRIVCVRGPRTARALGVEQGRAITDAAALIRTVQMPPAPSRRGYVGFMPHHVSALRADWSSIAREAGLLYIDPRQPVDRVLSLIQGASRLVTEAMHGAIVADALRVPWTPVSCYSHVNSFKWQDWCDSLNLPYSPTQITSVVEPFSQRPAELVRHLRAVARVRYWEPWPRLPVDAGRTTQQMRDNAVSELQVASRADTYLSMDADIGRATERLLEALDEVRKIAR